MRPLDQKRIFIVEDNPANRAVTTALLTRHGAEVRMERWGRDAVRQLRTFGPVDLIILDLMLSDDISGFDVFDQIRALPDFNAVPIVAVSATDPSSGIPECQQKGFNGFISKPIEFTLFAEQIASLINGETVWYTNQQTDFR
ncbi:MAG: response regulator [Chloroflexi bacterium]|nr:response regulator [Chloroflexota bacterium]